MTTMRSPNIFIHPPAPDCGCDAQWDGNLGIWRHRPGCAQRPEQEEFERELKARDAA